LLDLLIEKGEDDWVKYEVRARDSLTVTYLRGIGNSKFIKHEILTDKDSGFKNEKLEIRDASEG
jgi:hypothetical protein